MSLARTLCNHPDKPVLLSGRYTVYLYLYGTYLGILVTYTVSHARACDEHGDLAQSHHLHTF